MLLDVKMRGMDGIEALRAIRARHLDTRVIVLTAYDGEEFVTTAIKAGATGYLLKDADAGEVAGAIRAAVAGEVHLDPAAAKALTASLRAPRSMADALTAREREVLALLARGGTNRELGRLLGVTERTARTHVSNILAKLGLVSRTQAAMWAVKHGLAEPSGPPA
jgi:DNA-binding NarL/FixJ family response regulator